MIDNQMPLAAIQKYASYWLLTHSAIYRKMMVAETVDMVMLDVTRA